MKILHVIPSISPQSGGPAKAVLEYARLCSDFAEVTIIATNEGLKDFPFVEPPSVKVLTFPYSGSHSNKVSPQMFKWMKLHIRDFDVVHIHAAFSVMSTRAARLCQQLKVPYVFRPLGTLSPYSLKSGNSVMKWFYLKMVEERTLQHAKALHATSSMERLDLQRGFNARNVHIIPLAVQLKVDKPRERKDADILKIGFISRLDPKKNIEGLIDALKHVKVNFELSIAGSGDILYMQHLESYIKKSGVGHKIKFLGFIDGDEAKSTFFKSIDFFVLNSFHENFGLAVAEALAHGVPTLLSHHVDLSGWLDHFPFGLTAGTKPENIADMLNEAAAITNEHYAKMSASAISFVRQTLSDESIRQQLKHLYSVCLERSVHSS